MSIRVRIPTPLRSAAGGRAELEVEAADVASLLERLAIDHAPLRDRIFDEDGNLRSFIRLFVNDEDVRFLQDLRTPLAAGDTVAIVPAIAGGALPM
jgi:molybdopterin synthase sulfur carrier subunit